jgi:hypothetical protein
MMDTQSPETRREKNNHTYKTFAPSWVYLQDYTGMHGKQNIKFLWRSDQPDAETYI